MGCGVENSISPIFVGFFLNGQTCLSISVPLVFGVGTYLGSAFAFCMFFRRIRPSKELIGFKLQEVGSCRSIRTRVSLALGKTSSGSLLAHETVQELPL